MFCPNNANSIAMIFNAGKDFPDDIVRTFESWSINLTARRVIDKPSARGLVFYEEANFNRKAGIVVVWSPSSDKRYRERIPTLDRPVTCLYQRFGRYEPIASTGIPLLWDRRIYC